MLQLSTFALILLAPQSITTAPWRSRDTGIMDANQTALAALRREIDGVDEALHDLLMRRSALVARVSAAKRGGTTMANIMFPAREAAILRRLLTRHREPPSAAVIGRLWREIISAAVRRQMPLAVAVAAPAHGFASWDLARDHFGSATPLVPYRAAARVLAEVRRQKGLVGVLPLPRGREAAPWWPGLARGGVRVFARLPFCDRAAGRRGPAALAVAPCERGATGEDVSLCIVTGAATMTRPRLSAALARASFEARVIAMAGRASRRKGLVELAGYVADEDERFAALIQGARGIARAVVPIGGYAVPFAARGGA